jgi:DNA-binding NarL/FixJ family response regulator
MRFQTEADLTVVGKADNLGSALEIMHVARPDIVLLDPAGITPEPVVALAAVLQATPGSKVVVLSLDDDPASRDRMLAAGASAFVSKRDGSEPLPDVIRRVVNPIFKPESFGLHP